MADWVVDIGPGAGTGGGTVVLSGTPTELVGSGTITGNCLKEHLS